MLSMFVLLEAPELIESLIGRDTAPSSFVTSTFASVTDLFRKNDYPNPEDVEFLQLDQVFKTRLTSGKMAHELH